MTGSMSLVAEELQAHLTVCESIVLRSLVAFREGYDQRNHQRESCVSRKPAHADDLGSSSE
jgi:hypothetical protein